MPNGTVHDLESGHRYRVRRDFTDYYGGHFAVGEILTFQQNHFLPYHGGNTIQFAERTLYLQDEENADILQDLWTYLEAVDDAGEAQEPDRSLTMPGRRRKMMGPILVGCGVVALVGCVYLAFSVSRVLRPYWLDRRLIDTITSSMDRDNPGLVKARLNAGANVNATDDLGDTPLILVARYGYTATARLLLVSGADVNARDKEGMSAVMEAAKGGHAAGMELLLSHGAEIGGKNIYGETALSLARDNRHSDCVRLLKQHGAKE